MSTAVPSTALVSIQPVYTDAEHLALAGFLAGYRGLTREAYALHLRQFTASPRPLRLIHSGMPSSPPRKGAELHPMQRSAPGVRTAP
jgi:hypothetical protein